MRKRAELLAHIQHTNSHYKLAEMGKKLASKANCEGGIDQDKAGNFAYVALKKIRAELSKGSQPDEQ